MNLTERDLEEMEIRAKTRDDKVLVGYVLSLIEENKRLKTACDLFEKNSADAAELQRALRLIEEIALNFDAWKSFVFAGASLKTEEEKALSQIYTISHGFSTCHDGCPVKQEGRKLASEHPIRTPQEKTSDAIHKEWDSL